MTPDVMKFGMEQLTNVSGSTILEVGSQDVNGSLKPYLMAQGPLVYIGVDMQPGKSVDEVLHSSKLVERFGRETFDIVISTEMLEHCLDWQSAVSNMKNVLKPGGSLLLTARSPGFPRHCHPDDYWRFTGEIFMSAFSDMRIVCIQFDSQPGIMMMAVKPDDFIETDISEINAVSMKGA